MKTFCPFCGIANVSEAAVCRACGTPLPLAADGEAPVTQSSSFRADGQTFEVGVPYPAPPTNGYVPQSAWPNAASPQLPSRQTRGSGGRPAWDPSSRQAPPVYGGSVTPTGPYNGAYPAQYVPVQQPSVNMYLPGDPRASAQFSAGGGVLPSDPRFPATPLAGPYAVAPYGAGAPPMQFATVPAYLQTGQPELADFGMRLGAFLLDATALSVPWFILMGLAAATASTTLAGLTLMLMFLGPALYFVTAWANGGQTLGYRALGLRLVRTDGSRPGVGSAIARCLGIFICLSMLIPGVLGFMWMLWDDRKQTLHDKMSDTLVVKS